MAYNIGSSSPSSRSSYAATGLATGSHIIASIDPPPVNATTYQISMLAQDDGNDRNKSWKTVSVTVHWVGGVLKLVGSPTTLTSGTSGPSVWTFSVSVNGSTGRIEVSLTVPAVAGSASARVTADASNAIVGTQTHPNITPFTYFGSKLLSWVDVSNYASLTIDGNGKVTSIAESIPGSSEVWDTVSGNGYNDFPAYNASGFNNTAMPFLGLPNSSMVQLPGGTVLSHPQQVNQWGFSRRGGTSHRVQGTDNNWLFGIVFRAANTYYPAVYPEQKFFNDNSSFGNGGFNPKFHGGGNNWGSSYTTPPDGSYVFIYNYAPNNYWTACFQLGSLTPVAKDLRADTGAHPATLGDPGAYQQVLLTSGDWSQMQFCEAVIVKGQGSDDADAIALAGMMMDKWGV